MPVSLPGLPLLELEDMPSFIYVHGSYPAYFEMVPRQFSNLDKTDFVLLNTFYKLEDKIKSDNPNISEYELMKKCMYFFKDQFSSSFCKDDSSMESGSAKEDADESILAGEAQDPDDDLEDNDDLEDVENIEAKEYHELSTFWHSLKEDKRVRIKNKP
ncbi:UDP-glucosyltransferase 74F2 [Actinidia rufa]|uniref:UDP-glucosyltransferase 74F2 n=1 Tax=Actinidia rufa TaxID=165716 RepID=A0A7J0E9I9_9ERIC|nr:UDP-glucosyltransferase 74F2 [Actinidia rufa]